MNFLELKTKVRQTLWADGGEQENLVAMHDTFFQEALFDISKFVPCYQFGNTNVFPHCATYFQCGMTVLPAPRGHITRVYTIDRLNEDGEEDANAVPDWCTKVDYTQVEFCHIQQYAQLCERCGSGTAAIANAALNAVFGIFRIKRRYPAPTDEGLESLPKLPQGFHYPQASTDAAGRSPGGVWALHRGRIYLSPWIQSSETVVIEWTGIKRNWQDTDLVDDDPKFAQAVRLHVGMQHAMNYDNDPARYQSFKDQFYGNVPLGIPGALPELIHECHQETRVRRCSEAGTTESAARGMGAAQQANLFSNDRQEYTASCPAGMTGASVTAVVEAGEVSSALSVADANARAKSLAQQRASEQLECEVAAVTYWNTEQSYTAYCPGASGDTPAADGNPATVVIPANTFSSTTSQAAANALALAAATSQANAALVCTYWNAPQTHEAECPEGTTGDSVEKTVAAHTFNAMSQSLANSQALAEAKRQAESELVCDDVTVAFYNSPTSATAQKQCVCNGTLQLVTVTVNVPPGVFSSIISQADATMQAHNAAQSLANALANARCAAHLCGPYTASYGVG